MPQGPYGRTSILAGGGSVKIELKCAECGGNNLTYPMVMTGTSVITCADCEHELGTVADIQEKVVEQLKNRISD
jgi:DNA-directed RNA polymerase subunit RPC12/RpoP